MKSVIAITLLMFANLSLAGGYTGKSNVKWVGTIVGNYFSIGGDWRNPMNCTKHDGLWKISSTSGSMEELKVMYSTALAAYTSGNTIELYAHECGSDGRTLARSMYTPSRTGN